MKNFILSIDQGTTGSTAIVVNKKTLEVVAKKNFEYEQIYPKPGWVEHNLYSIWDSVEKAVIGALKAANINGSDIYSIGITNQRETTCAYKSDGTPLENAIVWQDRRTADFCDSKRDHYTKLQKKTGLPLDPYFSGTKMRWFLDNSEKVQDALKNSNLYFSTIDTYLTYRLTGNQAFVTEPSNASRTLLMDLDACQWDNELLDFFKIPKESLPKIKDSFSNFGSTKGLTFLPDGIPITCILGDQQAALFGQGGYKKSSLKCTYGTGAFILLNTGEEKVYSSNGLLTTVAYQHKGKKVYALEGAAYIAGAAVQWLRDNLKIIETSPEVESLAKQANNFEDLEHLLFFPFFTGIGSPYWNADAKGAIVGLTRGTERSHIARACLEGMALSINDSIKSLIADSPAPVESINVDGGACANNLLMQIQANFSQTEIVRPVVIETTAYGVALGSLVGNDELNLEEISKVWKKDKSFSPEENDYYDKKSNLWNEKIKKIFMI